MKKVIFENGLRAFLATCCFLILGVVTVNAQSQLDMVVQLVPGMDNLPTPNIPLYDVPQGSFLNNASAISVLSNELVTLKQAIMASNDPAVVDALMVKWTYYNTILQYLHQGATVPHSIVAGLWIFLQADAYGLGDVSQSVQQSLKTDAINLLKQ